MILRRQNEEPIKILSLFAGQFRLIYQVKELLKADMVSSKLQVHLRFIPSGYGWLRDMPVPLQMRNWKRLCSY